MKAEFFYADDGLVASTDPGWIQSVFDTLTGLFEQVGLQINVKKNVRIVCKLCQAAEIWSDEAYTRKNTGRGGVSRRGSGSG